MNTHSYVMANIALPIEVTPNNDYKLLKDRIKIDFGFCKDLPGPTSTQDMEVVSRLFPSWSSYRRSPSPSPQVSSSPSPQVTPSPSPQVSLNPSPKVTPQVTPSPSPRVSRSSSPEPVIPEKETVVYTPRSIRSPSHSPPHTRPSTPEPKPEPEPEPEQPQSTKTKTPEESARALFLALSQRDKTHKHKNRMTFRKYPSKPKQKYTRRVYD